jgi:hypothetical protein
VVKPEVL